MSEQALLPSSLKVADIATGLIDLNQNNPNEMDDASFARLVDEIRDVGFLVPIIVVTKPDGRYRILNGEHRWKAASSLGYKHVPSIILEDERWSDPDLFDLVNIRLNEIRGKVSASKLEPIYHRVIEKYGQDAAQKMVGITHDDVWKKLAKKMANSMKKNVSPEVAEQIDQAVKTAKDPISLNRKISKIIIKESHVSDESNCVIFQLSGKEHIVIKCQPHTFAVVSDLVRMAQQNERDINSVLYDSLSKTLVDFKDQLDRSIDVPQQ